MAAHRYWKVALTDLHSTVYAMLFCELEPKIGGNYHSMNNSFLPHPYGKVYTPGGGIEGGESPAAPFNRISDGDLTGNYYYSYNYTPGYGFVTTYIDFRQNVDIQGFRIALGIVNPHELTPNNVSIYYSDDAVVEGGDPTLATWTLAQETITTHSDWASGVFKNFEFAAANAGPTASNLSITGSTVVGSLLTGNYTYADADNDLEGVSTFRWLRNATPIGGATSITYTTTQADVGNLITFEVTPVALTGAPATGPATSTGVYITNSAASMPKNIRMKNGIPRVISAPVELTLFEGNIIPPSDSFMRIKADSAIALNATTPISSGLFVGQEILLENSNHGFPANTITIPTGGNIKMSGGTSMVLNAGSTLSMVWDGTYWIELSRSTNS